jgi:glutathione S-transferase
VSIGVVQPADWAEGPDERNSPLEAAIAAAEARILAEQARFHMHLKSWVTLADICIADYAQRSERYHIHIYVCAGTGARQF